MEEYKIKNTKDIRNEYFKDFSLEKNSNSGLFIKNEAIYNTNNTIQVAIRLDSG